MSKFIHHIYYRPGFKVGKPESLSRHSGEEKLGIDAQVFDEGQWLDHENDDRGKKKMRKM